MIVCHLSSSRNRSRATRALRRWLGDGGAIALLLAVLLRALVPAGFMFDAGAPAGAFGLVLCSGHGAMAAAAPAGVARVDAPAALQRRGEATPKSSPATADMAGMGDMKEEGGASPPRDHDGNHDANHDAASAPCAFAAALFASLAAMAVWVFLLSPTRAADIPRRERRHLVIPRPPRHRPAARGPPDFA